MLDFAVSVARQAGSVLRANFGKKIDVAHKGKTDLVTEIDIASERLIKELITSHYPKHRILAEESEPLVRSSEYCWIVDPLDGTTNYAHGVPFFSVSIALEKEGKIVLGVIYDPIHDELFSAERGSGATLNGRKITVSKIDNVSKSLLVTGFPYDIHTDKLDNIDNFVRFIKTAQAVRRLGSAALDLCYVACGRIEGFWELKLKPWDMAAGALIVKEAGGEVTRFNGEPFDHYLPEIVASNGLIHSDMVRILTQKPS
ncbi:MAG: inositol monophosphatase family protein [Acidobacteriota bacterium]|nr:inositol monophosphatase [Blastocatellia bacterium]MDW8412467.1 inositol monophosphatase family protein [Acidobacteriota bacterium]